MNEEEEMLIEIQMSVCNFKSQEASMLVLRNVSYVYRQQKMKSEQKYQELMVKTMSHE